MDPHQDSATATQNIARQFVDSLTIQDAETKELLPWLATDWSVNDDSTEFTFHLRDDVTFSNGEKFDAENVKANFDYIRELGALSQKGSGYLQGYQETEVVDEHTVVVKFDRPRVSFLASTADSILGMLAIETLDAGPEAACTGENVIGTGPFVMESVVMNESVSLVKREGYNWAPSTMEHQGDAYLDGIEFSILPERSVRVGALQSGQVDTSMGIPPLDAGSFTASGYSILTFSNPGIANNLSVNSAALNDVKVRRALLKAMDREEIRQVVYGGVYDSVTSTLSPSTIGYVDMSDELAYDPEEAAKLLDEAGWVMGPDGVREKDGQPLVVTSAHYSPGNDVLIELVQQQFAQVGVQLDVSAIVGAITDLRHNGTFNMLQTQQTSLDPDVLRSVYSPVTGDNSLQVSPDSELAQLLEDQAAETDEAKRMEMIGKIQQILIEDAYTLPMNLQTQVQASSDKVKGLTFNLNANLALYDVQLVQ